MGARQEAAWELPPSAREVASSPADMTASSALVPLQDPSASWTEVFDEATTSTYYFNTSTQVNMRETHLCHHMRHDQHSKRLGARTLIRIAPRSANYLSKKTPSGSDYSLVKNHLFSVKNAINSTNHRQIDALDV